RYFSLSTEALRHRLGAICVTLRVRREGPRQASSASKGTLLPRMPCLQPLIQGPALPRAAEKVRRDSPRSPDGVAILRGLPFARLHPRTGPPRRGSCNFAVRSARPAKKKAESGS